MEQPSISLLLANALAADPTPARRRSTPTGPVLRQRPGSRGRAHAGPWADFFAPAAEPARLGTGQATVPPGWPALADIVAGNVFLKLASALGCALLLLAALVGSVGFLAMGQFCLLPVLANGLSRAGIARGLRDPVKAVAKAAARITAGDRSVRVAKSRTAGGLGELIDTFNAMAHTLDVRERERSQIAAGISHELRTPITILMARLHAIGDGVIPARPDETARLLRQLEHLLHIVDDLDAMARTDIGQLPIEREYIDLQDLVRSAAADLQPLAARHGLLFEGQFQTAPVLGDRRRLVQVFTNLLTNAIKHSPHGGQVRVIVAIEREQVVASVLDEGPGIAPGDLELVFKPFWRSAATRRRPGCSGTGMGLALTAKLVRAHGGRVEAINREDRSGAAFRVVLPLA